MASRLYDQYNMTIQKRSVTLWAIVGVPTGTTPVLLKWNYPQLGASGGAQGALARTYSAAPSTGGGTTFPTRYVQGYDGVFSVVRTGTGLWTVTLQDNYQRVLNVFGAMACNVGVSTNIVTVTENLSIQNMNAAGGSVIGVKLSSASGTPADPTADASTQIRIQLELADATEP